MKGKTYREAAEATSVEKIQPISKSAPSKSPRTGLIMEVVIPITSKTKSSSGASTPVSSRATSPPTSSAAEVTEADQSDSNLAKGRQRRVPKRAILISDEEEQEETFDDFQPTDEDNDCRPKYRVKKATYAKRPKASKSSDYEESSAEETQSDGETAADTAAISDDEASGKPKRKSHIKSKAKVAKKNTATTSDDESMDLDDSNLSKGKAKKTAKKRKAENDDKRPAKKQKRREDSDPWKLRSHAVKKDWSQMQAPPLEMFHFARKVVDEYTYLDGKIHSMVTNLTAERHWVLSGTPPIHDFGALKTISAFLNLHLGVDDDSEGQSSQVKKRRREQTGKMFAVLAQL